MANNMYRVGDYVYFETSSTSPYQIRRIEELNKTPSGNVEAKVMCFYRRRDISSSLIMLADKHQKDGHGNLDLCRGFKKLLKGQETQGPCLSETVTQEATQQGALDEDESDSEGTELGGSTIVTPTGETLNSNERHQLRHRELFLSRQIETLPATHIRGKCTVTLLNETELLLAYLNKDDTFFYSLVYDPQQKTLLADKGEIRVGSRYQADITSLLKEGEGDGRNLEELESLVWTPGHGLTDRQIDQFLVMSRSVGTFARALDCSSSVKQPSLHMSAAAASRDVTLFHAMDTLHKHNYDISKALCSLIPATGPVLCRDEMEEWSASEANLFEEALEKYGKDFNDIRQDFLPWKTLKNIIEYYYMWKTTDRYVQQKRVKAVEAESKLKQVYIPNYNKPNPAALSNGKTPSMVNGADISVSGKACESCHATNSSQWYAWGPSHLQCRLCNSCWQYWKKFGGLKLPSRIGKEEADIDSESGRKSADIFGEERLHSGGSRSQRCNVGGCGREYKTRSQLIRHAAQAHGVALRAGSPRPIMKTRAAIMVHTSLPIRVMRRLCEDLIQPRKACRNPTWPVNATNIRQESLLRMGGKSFDDFAYLVKRGTGRRRGRVSQVSVRLGQKNSSCPAWMLPTDKSLLPKQPHIAFPKPPKGPDGSLIYTPVPNKELPVVNNTSPTLLKRRAYEETNGMDEGELEEGVQPAKRQKDLEGLDSLHLNQLGVIPPPGLTVTPVGVNGGPGVPPPGVPTPPLAGVPNLGAPSTPGRAKIATVSRVGGRPRIISWMDAPDDVYFYATDTTKKLRKSLTTNDLKRAARRPWKKIQEKELSPSTPTPASTPITHITSE
ncbi:metastasis-associated protein MTA3-like isoform X4 [Homarus americanus]|uniref:metastasis-associated protein MTA3-like isoform X4 n=1 Tax=Homarus americanus TaxID=6706 RepID=UPI001C459CF4|nr:metastasis-associated protein MTA3-like isoform X4 [Homarus americanus]